MERAGAAGQVAVAVGSKMHQHCARGALDHKDQQTMFLVACD
jgi:hypothetical protein